MLDARLFPGAGTDRKERHTAVFEVGRFGTLPRLPLDLAPVLNSRVNEYMYH